MQATHGLVVTFRSRIRVIGTLAIALALSALVFASAASAKSQPPQTYLALGDSLAFGYSRAVVQRK